MPVERKYSADMATNISAPAPAYAYALNVAALTRSLILGLQECVEWLVEADIVRALLRAHLHQRQYVDQVQRVLKILAAEGGFQSDHLELLWALTEKARHSHSSPA